MVRTLVDIMTHPVSPGPHTLVAVIAVLVSLAPVGPVATPGVGSAPPPAAFLGRAEAVDLRQVGMLAQRKVSPVCAARPAPVVVAGGQTVGVGGAGTLVRGALPVWPAPPLTAVVPSVPQSARLGGAVVCPTLQQPGALGVILTVALSYITVTLIITTKYLSLSQTKNYVVQQVY